MSEDLWHDLIDTERQLRRAAEEMVRRWREAFFAVAAVVAAADYEARLRSGTLPTSPEEAARWLSGILNLTGGWRGAPADDHLREIERLRSENARLSAEVARLKATQAQPARPVQEERRPTPRPPAPGPVPAPAPPPPQGTAAVRAETERAAEETETAAGETHPAPPLDVSELRRFLSGIKPPQYFQSEFFEKDGLLVATIGYFGVSSRPRLAKTLASALGLSSKAGSLTRCFERCARLGLVRVYKEGGAPFSLVSLTERGREAFRQMFGHEPVLSEADLLLRSHPGNITHAVYCAWAREFAEVAGYEVEILGPEPTATQTADLVFRLPGATLYVEVERALGGNPLAKWQAVARKRDPVAVITPDGETRERVRSLLKQAGIRRYLATDFSFLVQKQPRTPEEFWAEREEAE